MEGSTEKRSASAGLFCQSGEDVVSTSVKDTQDQEGQGVLCNANQEGLFLCLQRPIEIGIENQPELRASKTIF
jgi:hypothetical protein